MLSGASGGSSRLGMVARVAATTTVLGVVIDGAASAPPGAATPDPTVDKASIFVSSGRCIETIGGSRQEDFREH